MNSLGVWILGIFFAIVFLSRFLPRVCIFIVGPGILMCMAFIFIEENKYFFFFQSDGSPAGFVVPFFAWGALLIGCGLGIAAIKLGMDRLKEEE